MFKSLQAYNYGWIPGIQIWKVPDKVYYYLVTVKVSRPCLCGIKVVNS